MEQGNETKEKIGSCSYCPDDNKLRFYPFCRLDKEDYDKVRAAGFRWAPKQELFVAPMWTPDREDLLMEMAGEIGDEDTSLIDRQEERAERFEGYSDNRKKDADNAHAAVKSITNHIPMGQPILVGHHSERRARKDAERIENGMRKAVNMWETSKYWTYRAAGALRHAKYKERPDVRARRIKKIEAAKRKQERTKADAEKLLKAWSDPVHELTLSRAKAIANYDHDSKCFTLEEYPREPPISQYEGPMGRWGALDNGIITPEQARDLAIPGKQRVIAWCDRWISHYNNRLLYEKAMLGEQGRLDLLEKPKRPKPLPLLNYRAPDGIQVENSYHKGEFSLYPQVEMTKAQYKEVWSSARGVRKINGTHRIKVCSAHSARKHSRFIDEAIKNAKDGTARANIVHGSCAVFLTDSNVHEKPEPIEPEPVTPKRSSFGNTQPYTPPERTEFDDLKDRLKEGVKVVSAPQLFVTPPEIAEKMVEYADIEPGNTVLEPSAGTGNIVQAIMNTDKPGAVVIVEINQPLAQRLEKEYPLSFVHCTDFLEYHRPDHPSIDAVVMNPPFVNGSDIKHINHALTFLKPGGRLVALCANGPRQRAAFMDVAEHWEDLPEGSFKESGTNVNVALMVLTT